MLHKSPSKQRREDSLILGILGLVLSVIIFIKGGKVVRLFLLSAIGVVVGAYTAYKIINVFTGTEKGAKFAYYWNEIMYSLLGIPILVISTFYLPVIIYILFFAKQNLVYITWIKWLLIGLTVVLQVLSLYLVIRRRRKEKKKTKAGEQVLSEIEKVNKNKKNFEELLDMDNRE